MGLVDLGIRDWVRLGLLFDWVGVLITWFVDLWVCFLILLCRFIMFVALFLVYDYYFECLIGWFGFSVVRFCLFGVNFGRV